jgi:hypothetical protein
MARPIDADALKALYEKALRFDPHEYIPPSEVIADIEAAPTIEAKPVVHGEWEITEDDWHSLTLAKCSLCHEEWCFETFEEETLHHYNFCPNCGADMRERKET